MIYTVTLNPSIDYVVHMEDYEEGKVNRTDKEEYLAGGKGINVSVVLHNLGVDNIALGFVAGFTGAEIVRLLQTQGVNTDFIKLEDGMSRINVKVKTRKETEINCQGPIITTQQIGVLYDKISKLQPGDIMVLAGSVPKGLPDSLYADIVSVLNQKGVKTVVDTTGNHLKNVLQYRPFLIKPNHHELSEIFGVTIKDRDDIIYYAKKLQSLGARNVLVSRAEKGAILITDTNEVLESLPPEGKVVNSVGAGDSMVAGFVTGYHKTGDYMEALKLGIAAGSATAFSSQLATKEQIEKLL